MSTYEYRVVWQREGYKRKKVRRYGTEKGAQRWLGMLTSDEPWKYITDLADRDPDDFYCCHGDQCGCAGMTIREQCEKRRRNMPLIIAAWIERRCVGKWSLASLRRRMVASDEPEVPQT